MCRETILFNLCHSFYHRQDFDKALFYGRQIQHLPEIKNIIAGILLHFYEKDKNQNYLDEGILLNPNNKYLAKFFFKKAIRYLKIDKEYILNLQFAAELGEQHAMGLMAEHFLSRALNRHDDHLLTLAEKWFKLATVGDCNHEVRLAGQFLLLIYSLYIAQNKGNTLLNCEMALKYGNPVLNDEYHIIEIMHELLGEKHQSLVIYMQLCHYCFQLCQPSYCSKCLQAIYCSSYW